jgi:hypothetical protein
MEESTVVKAAQTAPATENPKPTSDTSGSTILTQDLSDDEAELGSTEDDLIHELKSTLSQVKNKRICTYSAYEYMRHLSVLRFFQWTAEGKSDQEAARKIAELFWEYKDDATQDFQSGSQNALEHKANSIKKWAKEFRSTGRLEEHSHGTHKKTESALAREDIAKAAQRELVKMDNPGPVALKDVLLSKVFPKFGIQDSKISENTCREYMKKWGWNMGGYRKWVPKTKRIYDELRTLSDDGEDPSDETAILDAQNKPTQETYSFKTQFSQSPIPSPTTVLKRPSGLDVTMPPMAVTMDEFQSSSLNITSPFHNTMVTIPDQPSFWPSTPHFPTQCQVYPMRLPNQFHDMSHFHQEGQPSEQYPRQHYSPKPMEDLVPLPEPMGMTGMRPAINNAPVQTFTPDPSLMAYFTHDTSFPTHVSRKPNDVNVSNSVFNPAQDTSYLSNMK